jgi:hypothetical protein
MDLICILQYVFFKHVIRMLARTDFSASGPSDPSFDFLVYSNHRGMTIPSGLVLLVALPCGRTGVGVCGPDMVAVE